MAAPLPNLSVKWIVRALAALLVVVVLLALGGWLFLRASLPQLDGERALAGLGAPVTVERDSLGVVRIVAQNRLDATRALGFIHAQDRFFGMDLLRRAAAGELSALLGSATVDTDRVLRPHRFRVHAREAVALLSSADRALLTAYTEGVNAGLDALGARPFEYGVLREAPARWQEEDAFLVAYAMFLDLQRAGLDDELETRAERLGLPPAVRAFLDPAGDAWDAPLMGAPIPASDVPPADSLDGYRPGPVDPAAEAAETYAARAGAPPVGSNNGAVAGARTETGAALVADDMHLGLRLPHIWYRAQIEIGDQRIGGVTLPGVPAVIVGSTRHVAWGFTNSYGDFSDLVRLVPGATPGTVRTATGEVVLDTLRETIAVAHGDPVALEVVQSPWGPVLYTDESGAAYAVQWAAYRPESVNLALGDLWEARSLDDALAIAHRAGVPAQNFVVGDRTGRVAWTIIGRIPQRTGRDGQMPTLSTDPAAAWSGWVDAAAVPVLSDPTDGLIWTANNRVASGEALALIGLGPYAHGARAHQIRDNLQRHTGRFSERDLLDVYLDDRAVYYERWQRLLLDVLDDDAVAERGSSRASLRERVQGWDGRASVTSPGYGVVKRFHDGLAGRLTPAMMAPARARYADADDLSESALYRLVTEQPAEWLPEGAASWDALLLEAADAAGDVPQTWGEQNRAAIAHPLAEALPFVGRWLRMPADPLAGDGRMPRVARPTFGASERMVVSPGFEERGILHMPSGNAGHPLSPYWGAGHDAWVEGRPLPFLAGRARWTLRLHP